MTPQRIFTRQLMGLDYRVWRVMLIISLLSVGLLSYRLMDSKNCNPVNFLIKTIAVHTDSTYTVGENLSFIASVNSDNVTWDFGDNSDKVTGQYVTHTYRSPGSYQISATTGITCMTLKKITVEAGAETDTQLTGDEIIGPVSSVIGKEEVFTTMVTAKVFEWSVANYKLPPQTGSTAKFKFPSAGKYTVQLTLDGDRLKRYTKEVTVAEAPRETSSVPETIAPLIPTEENPAVPALDPLKAVIIPDATFKEYLEKVNAKQMTVADFNKYLCYKGDTKAVLNGDLMTFTQLCDELSGKKRKRFILGKTKIKIETAVMRRDSDGCVNIVEVKYH